MNCSRGSKSSFAAQQRFVANASHELRTPLTVERTLLQVALADPNASAAKLRATCEELLASGREHERLIEALLTLARGERGIEHPEPVDLSVLAGRALGAVASEIGAARITTALDPAPTTGDPALIERLIANLIDNAVRHNDGRGEVDVRTTQDRGAAVVSVGNSGAVIAPEDLERLFEPFRRLHGDRRADGHHGLGLSIVRAIAAAHSAALNVVPQLGGGLMVTVRFEGSSRGVTAPAGPDPGEDAPRSEARPA